MCNSGISDNYLGFLYKTCDISHYCMEYWLSVPEFKYEMQYLKAKNVTITKSLVFRTMQDIYFEKEEDAEQRGRKNVDFQFAPARKALKQLSEKLTGTRDNWDKEIIK